MHEIISSILGWGFILIWLILAISGISFLLFWFRLKYKHREFWIGLGQPELYKRSPFDKRNVMVGFKIISKTISDGAYNTLCDPIMSISIKLYLQLIKIVKLILLTYAVFIIIAIITNWNSAHP
jgi:hypothetical protein